MGALSAARDTLRMGNQPIPYQLNAKIKANAVGYKGGIVVIDSTGYAKAGLTATGLVVIGVAEDDFDATGLASGALEINVRQGVFKFANSSGDPLAIGDVGGLCYVENDQTISKTSGGATQSVAGTFVALDDDGGVWVWLGLAPQSTSALAALAALAVQTSGVQTIDGVKTFADVCCKIQNQAGTFESALRSAASADGILTLPPGTDTLV